MPYLQIVDSYSHMFGEAILDQLHPALKREVVDVITKTKIPQATKRSKEKTRYGQIVWSGKDFNGPLSAALKDLLWEKRKVIYPGQTSYYIDVDFARGQVAVEIQFGKYAFVQHDFAKFRYLFEQSEESLRIDVGIEVVPSASLQKNMYSGPGSFESVTTSLLAHARNDPAVPIWLLAIDIK